jgi:predicted DNA-binding transcriptional regulator AlpA
MLKLNDLPQETRSTTHPPDHNNSPFIFNEPSILSGFLRREELAQQLGLSPRTIDRWEALRIGPPRCCVGRTVLYRIEAVRQWLQTREEDRYASSPGKYPRTGNSAVSTK